MGPQRTSCGVVCVIGKGGKILVVSNCPPEVGGGGSKGQTLQGWKSLSDEIGRPLLDVLLLQAVMGLR